MNTTTKPYGAGARSLLSGILVGAVITSVAWWLLGPANPGGNNPSDTSESGAMGGAMDMGSMETGSAPSAEGMKGMATTMGSGEAPAVNLSPEDIRTFGITFAKAEVRELESAIRTVGVVEAAESLTTEIAPRFSGFVEALFADFTGRRLRRGEPVMAVYSPELLAAQEELILARRLQPVVKAGGLPGDDAFGGPDLVASARRRLELWEVPSSEIQRIETTLEPSRRVVMTAPRDGIVLEKSIVEGSAFSAGQSLLTLADLSEVWVDVEVPEAQAWAVREGSSVQAQIAAFPGEAFSGRVDYVYPVLEENTRSLRARVVLANNGYRLRPGMYATVRLTSPVVRALSVPVDAVVYTGERTLLFIADTDGKIHPREVMTGRTLGGRVEVLEGLEEGERVVTSAQYLIDAEANIGAVMRSMMSMMGSGDMGNMDMEGMDMGGMNMEGR
ncbi:MAG: efflux RND transporter periplasmic adaptor subunit [Gemmatimonadota bacterium]